MAERRSKTIPLHSKRSRRALMGQHALAGLMLLLAAIENLKAHGWAHRVLMVVEILAAVALLAAIGREFTRRRDDADNGAGPVDWFVSAVLFLEAANKRVEGHSWALTLAYALVDILQSARFLIFT